VQLSKNHICNEKAREDEEQIDTDETALKMRKPGVETHD
jgi:hypothetical protein